MNLVPLDPIGLTAYKSRFAKIAENSPRQFGKMTATEMLNHVRLLVEVSLEERQLPDFSTWFTRTALFHWVLIEMLPWPKGKIKVPVDLLDPTLKSFDEERQLLVSTLERFAAAVGAQPSRITRSPMVGNITLQKWSRLHGRHLEHHLQQFGA